MKHLLILALIAAPSLLMAQDTEEINSEFKPDAGEKTLEVQFAPFGSNPISVNGIRARWFRSPDKAFRLNAFISVNTDTEITQQENADLNLKELKDKSFLFTVSIQPGYEFHLKGTDRLSPYFGWEADIAYRTSSFTSESQSGTDVNYIKQLNVNGFSRIGINAIAGLDYYVTKKLYLGTEFGFGAGLINLLPVKVESDMEGFEEPEPDKRGRSFDVGPNVNAQIRLGYAF